MDGRHRIGMLGERLAVQLLQRRGAVIIARNVAVPEGEIDVVAAFGRVRVAVEVRTRWAEDPLSAFDDAKLDRVRRSASRSDPPCHRVDLIAVSMDRRGACLHWLADL